MSHWSSTHSGCTKKVSPNHISYYYHHTNNNYDRLNGKAKLTLFKSHHRSRPSEDHDYTVPQVEQSHHDSGAGEDIELKQCDETQEEKDYYFMDTTLLG